MKEIRILAILGGGSSHAIQCGACNQLIAENSDGVLIFVRDSDPESKGWVRSIGWQPDSPGGLWEVAPQLGAKQPPLGDSLEVLPAIVECPACEAGNLLDPEHLVLRPNQLVARAHRTVRQLAE